MGTLYIVSTPIGNLEDITLRAAKTLFSVDIIACEDTRQTGLLLETLTKRFPHIIPKDGHKPAFLRYDDRTELRVAPEVIDALNKNKNIALVTDAGTPLISDPGYILVSEAKKRGLDVVSVPGSSAVMTALTSSGLPADKFTFLGYPPEKQANRLKLFRQLKEMNELIKSTYVFYCAPHKLITTLTEIQDSLGDVEISICRELTKTYEECWVGKISDALDHFVAIKGEVVLLIRL